MVFPFFSRITEKKHVFFSHFRQSYVCGKKMLSQEGVGLPKKARPASGRNFKSRSKEKERTKMSNKNNNQINIPQAREAMDRFKMQAAQEVGVNLTNGYNGHLTSREAGSVGGQMVKNGTPERTKFFVRKSRTKEGYCDKIRYRFRLSL